MFVPAICPQCGGKVNVDNSQKFATCSFCGTSFLIEQTTINNNTTIINQNYFSGAVIQSPISNSSTINDTKEVEKFLNIANNSIQEMNYNEALNYFTKAFEIDPYNGNAILGRKVCETRINNGKDFDAASFTNYFFKCIKSEKNRLGARTVGFRNFLDLFFDESVRLATFMFSKVVQKKYTSDFNDIENCNKQCIILWDSLSDYLSEEFSDSDIINGNTVTHWKINFLSNKYLCYAFIMRTDYIGFEFFEYYRKLKEDTYEKLIQISPESVEIKKYYW